MVTLLEGDHTVTSLKIIDKTDTDNRPIRRSEQKYSAQ